MDLAQESFGC